MGGLITLWYAQYFPKTSEIVGEGKGKGKYLEWKSRVRAANDDRFKGTRGFMEWIPENELQGSTGGGPKR